MNFLYFFMTFRSPVQNPLHLMKKWFIIAITEKTLIRRVSQ